MGSFDLASSPRGAGAAALVASLALAALAGCASHPAGSGLTGGGGTASSTGRAGGGRGLAWTPSIPPTAAGLGLVDIAAGPTNDVVVAATEGPAAFAQQRWTSA